MKKVKALITAALLVSAAAILVTATVHGAPTQIWPSTSVPAVIDAGPDAPVELGVTFRSSTSGYITGVRFYKGPNNTGTHVGNLWTNTGVLLARATFTNETGSGWQQVNFSTPVVIAANTLYVASYFSTNGHFSVTNDYFAASGTSNGPLTAPANGSGVGNGVFTYAGNSTFPTSTYRSSNYWVDVVFDTSSTPPPPPPSSGSTLWPATVVPAVVDAGPDSPVELGVTFRTNTNGSVSGIRFYKGPNNTGTHIGNLWTTTGTLLARATFTNETASGWQQVNLATPVAITANTLYVASYHTNGHFSVTNDYFATSGTSNGPLTAPANGNGVGNGVFAYGRSSAFPQKTYRSSNYWVDVAFIASGGVVAPPLSITTTSLAKGTQSVAYGATLAASGGTPPCRWLRISGSLPTGLTLSSSGVISGTPTVATSSTFTVQARDGAGSTASRALSINISPAASPSPSPVATNCTLYASPSGNDSSSGTSSLAPKTFQGSANAAQPGDVICVKGGTYNWSGSFYPPRNGMPNAWIVYKAYGDSPVNIVYTGTSANWTAMFHTGNNSFPNGRAYLEFNGFVLDGRNNAVDGFYIDGSHHLRILNNTIKNFGAAGIASVNSDYITADKNLIHHVGYGEGWSSGISLNSNKWFDNYAGFHNVVVNNIISGTYDNSPYHTDGNGIILDLGGSTPPVLVANNVVYGNGGRCIQANSNTNFWFVNNTCHSNGLDTSDYFGGLVSQNASNGYMINNISVPWNGRPAYAQYGSNSNVAYSVDMYMGSNNFSNSQLVYGNPVFVNPPAFNPTSSGQYATALAPWLLGDGLKLMPSSPARGRGIDPSALPGLPAAIISDLKKYCSRDINGNARPSGGPCNLGAYE